MEEHRRRFLEWAALYKSTDDTANGGPVQVLVLVLLQGDRDCGDETLRAVFNCLLLRRQVPNSELADSQVGLQQKAEMQNYVW